MSAATHGHGTELWLKSGATFVRVAEIDDIPELPNFDQGIYETSNFDTVDVKTFKKLPLKEGVELTVGGNYVIGGAAETLLRAADASLEPVEYRLVLKQGAQVFQDEAFALFYNLRFTNPAEEKRRFEIVLKPTAAFVPAAPPSGGGS